ncbi:DUF4190 domain-containing protein [Arthrobacter sp. zg-ZUI100]|uniref:Uncharacterized protein n=1 Tax=Arthrobacter jiangjiafuii TaxID=2817475 RepID=A0A975M5S7_9MICC|nr:DUF4190 domain-containing protein [Arthrobacter jiangjiafuii]MBP3037563.1 DUF4190 domain-containing protein [Arthrobacter jiangjiafuii]MBP3044810.1 DUF4190 domain-containing protein [Arthrobacter jiangjiafuii]QWC10365.1 hypothetical protein KKR91_01530 [Arthrobacter jiangjiafuii]
MNTTEPMPALLEAYFADLDRALIGTDARERAETVQAMREHAAEMLHRYGASEETAERVIGDFGPVEQVAAAATPMPAPASAPAPRSWSDIWLLVGSVVSLMFFVFPLFAIAMLVWAIVRIRRNGGNRTLQKAALWISGVSAAFSIGMFISHVVHAL